MASLPASVSYGKVVGRFLLAVGDNLGGSDPDLYPDAVPAQGYVTFNAAPDYVLNTSSGDYTTIYLDTIVCTLDANGYIIDPANQLGVWLVATDDPDNNPTDWTYTVTVTITNSPTTPKTFSITVPAGSTQDITLITPVSDSTGVPTIVGPPGPANSLTLGTVSSLGPTQAPTVDITGTSPNQTIDFGLPVAAQWRNGTTVPSGALGLVGDWYIHTTTWDVYEKTAVSTWTLRTNIKGATGNTGPAPNLTMGTVTNATPGAAPSASFSGTNPNYSLDLNFPLANWAMGTVTTLAAGASATATLGGTALNPTLSLGIPQGVSGGRWLSGSGAPASGTGLQGDWYVNNTSTNYDFYEKTAVSTWTLRGTLRGPQGFGDVSTKYTANGVTRYLDVYQTFDSNSGQTGSFVVRTNIPLTSSAMIGMNIIFEMLSGGQAHGELSFYCYNSTSGSPGGTAGHAHIPAWIYRSNQTIGLRIAKDSSDRAVLIFDKTATWPYTGFRVPEVRSRFGSLSDSWFTGWTSSFMTTAAITAEFGAEIASASVERNLFAEMVTVGGTQTVSGIKNFSGGIILSGRTSVDNSLGLSGGNLYFEGSAAGSMYFRPNGAGSNTAIVALTSTGMGLSTLLPTHALTLASGANGYADYNTADQTTNYERARKYWASSVYNIATEAGGTGAARPMKLTANNTTVDIGGTVPFAVNRTSTGVTTLFQFSSSGVAASSGTQSVFLIDPTINQSGTAGYTGLRMNITESATGSGAKRLLDLAVGGVSRLIVGNGGDVGVGAAVSSNLAYRSFVPGDTQNRWAITAAGAMVWGSGAVAPDTNLYRSAADILKTDDEFQAVTLKETLGGTPQRVYSPLNKPAHTDITGLAANYQPLDATLTAYASLSFGPDQMAISTGPDTFDVADVTYYARSILASADSSDFRSIVEVPSQAEFTTLQGEVANKEPIFRSYNVQAGAYTLAAGDLVGKVVINSASNVALTIPTNASVGFPIGTTIPIYNINTGDVTITPSVGVTLVGGKYKLADTASVAAVEKIGTDTWIVYGNVVA